MIKAFIRQGTFRFEINAIIGKPLKVINIMVALRQDVFCRKGKFQDMECTRIGIRGRKGYAFNIPLLPTTRLQAQRI